MPLKEINPNATKSLSNVGQFIHEAQKCFPHKLEEIASSL